MKEEHKNRSLESMVWLRARINSLNLGENSWQRDREICVGSSVERETLEHFMMHYIRWEEWRIEEQKAGPRTDPESKNQTKSLANSCSVHFGGHENNTKRRTLLKMWNERQRLIRNSQENAEHEEKSNSRRIEIRRTQVKK